MGKHLVLWTVAGSVIAGSSWIAMAQETQPVPAECSGFMCKVFGSKFEDRPTAAPAQPATKRAGVAPAPRKVAKPAPVVTIAADDAQAMRLKALATALPKTRVRIVKPEAAADFKVFAAVDGALPREKARLFTEQLHVVAGPGVRALADLEDKVVSFGPNGGPSQAAARKAFAALKIVVKETPLELENALDGMATGDVAATVVLAPQPDAQLARLKASSGFHLVSWPEGAAVPDRASAAIIPDTVYPGLTQPGESIRAVGVEAALEATGTGSGPAAKAFLASLSQHSATLSKHGFDLIKADLETRHGREIASAEGR